MNGIALRRRAAPLPPVTSTVTTVAVAAVSVAVPLPAFVPVPPVPPVPVAVAVAVVVAVTAMAVAVVVPVAPSPERGGVDQYLCPCRGLRSFGLARKSYLPVPVFIRPSWRRPVVAVVRPLPVPPLVIVPSVVRHDGLGLASLLGSARVSGLPFPPSRRPLFPASGKNEEISRKFSRELFLNRAPSEVYGRASGCYCRARAPASPKGVTFGQIERE